MVAADDLFECAHWAVAPSLRRICSKIFQHFIGHDVFTPCLVIVKFMDRHSARQVVAGRSARSRSISDLIGYDDSNRDMGWIV